MLEPSDEFDGIEKLKSIRESVNWEIEVERLDFLWQFFRLIVDWQVRLPNLRDIYRNDEIDWVIEECVREASYQPNRAKFRLIDFVARTGYKCEPEVDERGEPLLNQTTAVHRAVGKGCRDIFPALFEIHDKFGARCIDVESGLTHFHIACMYGCGDVVEKFLELGDDKGQPLQLDAMRDHLGRTPLHLAVDNNDKRVAELLLRRGADPTVADAKGSTPLHLVCTRYNDASFPSMLLEYAKERSRPQLVNAQDMKGNTALHLALDYSRTRLADWLMRNGADGGLTNAKGETPLHVACQHYTTKHLVGAFSRVNAQDDDGNTPLHLALKNGFKDAVESLLRNGANPNLSNAEGQTPLHVACDRADKDDDLIKLFFEVNDDSKRSVRVDARDDQGRTPLHVAVENVFHAAVDILLNRGADLTFFVFPSASRMKSRFIAGASSNPVVLYESQLRLVAGALACAERLEEGGYELDRDDALAIMKLFAEGELWERWSGQQKSLCNDEEFAREAKKVMVKPDLSVYDLVRLKPKEEDKLLAYADYYDLPDRLRKIRCLYEFRADGTGCSLHLWEKMSRGFFRRWALDSFRELIHDRLPLDLREQIFDQLANEDLFNICLAAAGEPR